MAFNKATLDWEVQRTIRKALAAQARHDHFLKTVDDTAFGTLTAQLSATQALCDVNGFTPTQLAASDDFNRADSASSMGGGWVMLGNTVGGISGNKGYFASATGSPRATIGVGCVTTPPLSTIFRKRPCGTTVMPLASRIDRNA